MRVNSLTILFLVGIALAHAQITDRVITTNKALLRIARQVNSPFPIPSRPPRFPPNIPNPTDVADRQNNSNPISSVISTIASIISGFISTIISIIALPISIPIRVVSSIIGIISSPLRLLFSFLFG